MQYWQICRPCLHVFNTIIWFLNAKLGIRFLIIFSGYLALDLLSWFLRIKHSTQTTTTAEATLVKISFITGLTWLTRLNIQYWAPFEPKWQRLIVTNSTCTINQWTNENKTQIHVTSRKRGKTNVNQIGFCITLIVRGWRDYFKPISECSKQKQTKFCSL